MVVTKQEIKNLITFAAANFPGMQNKELVETAKLWEEMLGGLPLQQVKEALKKVLATAKFFPTVADIQGAIQSIKDDQRNTNFQPLKKTGCTICGGGGFSVILQDGEDRYCRCPCQAGDRLNGWPMAPSWATQTDRRILQGEKVAVNF